MTELLRSVRYKKVVVLENFHYLNQEVQQLIAFDLKTFHEVSVRFVIMGIWKEANYLLMYNGDLQDRVAEVPVEPWSSSDFDEVARRGSISLNIKINDHALNQFKENAFGNIGMFQEFLKTFCQQHGVTSNYPITHILEDQNKVNATFEEKLEDQRGRLTRVLQTIAGKSAIRQDDALVLPFHLVKVILTAPVAELLEGIRRQDLLEKLRQVHNREDKTTIRMSDLSNLLKRIAALQEGIQPPFLYYDSNQMRLKIVDATQFFVLAKIDRVSIMEEILDPRQEYEM